MAEIRMADSRALSLLHKQQIRFTADRAQAIAELCDGAEAAITAVRDIATGSALDTWRCLHWRRSGRQSLLRQGPGVLGF
ncbi:hypothetical protein [Nonomuraea sp. NPDC049480]|uniref:hypothetical protein n=1 Tax=Nonomuraea sp. NPDC049480 TaxID=3364353 RepID=UPI0037B34D0A